LQNLDSTVDFGHHEIQKVHPQRPRANSWGEKKSKWATEEKIAPTTKHCTSEEMRSEDTKVHEEFFTTRKMHYQQMKSYKLFLNP